ncbi:MAG: CbiX/SirB N-terminal domain-containing protein [Comamonadaceae bacterium]|nr:CbiX/SirB N-terminal domain-containing protein [Comamonadaceae bacterium]
MNATILFGHGSSDPSWRAPIDKVASTMMAADPLVLVRCAFLERTEPDMATIVAELVQTGVNQITIVPMFLGVGRHAREDIPLLVSTIQGVYPSVNFQLKPSVGEEPAVIELLAQLAMPSTC